MFFGQVSTRQACPCGYRRRSVAFAALLVLPLAGCTSTNHVNHDRHTADRISTSEANTPTVIHQAGGDISTPEPPQDSEPNAFTVAPADRYPKPPTPLVDRGQQPDDRYPIDLPTALRLAGADNLQIALAAERVREAHANLDAAEVLWLPSINAGFGYNKHDGRIQETEGRVLEVSRSSTFVGGGPLLSGAPLTGASGGPARFFVDLSLADALFEPLAACQVVRAAEADQNAVFNDTLLQVAVAYLELLRAHQTVAVAEEAVVNARELARLTKDHADAGTGLPADAQRAAAELADRQRQQLADREAVEVASAELARLLRLDPSVTLFPADASAAPLELIEVEAALSDLIAQAHSARPEMTREDARIEETLRRLEQEHWRPLIPNLHVGLSAGGFGGGEGSFFGDFSGRSDFDAIAVWELRNLGLGTRAAQRRRDSQHVQAHLAAEQLRDRISAEVTAAYHQVRLRRRQIRRARTQVESAAEALPSNFDGIRADVLRAIEAQQALAALAAARTGYLDAVTAYNAAQFALLRALGRAPN